jgi:hypothetical protein
MENAAKNRVQHTMLKIKGTKRRMKNNFMDNTQRFIWQTFYYNNWSKQGSIQIQAR